jgi:hypothetical protein
MWCYIPATLSPVSSYRFTWNGPDEPQPPEPVSPELLADVERVLNAHGIRPVAVGPQGEALRRALIIEHVRRMARAYAGHDPEPYPHSTPGGPWLRASGGDLPAPVEVRVHRHADGRYVLTGLLIGEWQPEEITSQTLRQIRPGNILAALFADFDPDQPQALPFAEFPAAVRLAADINADMAGKIASSHTRRPDQETLKSFARTYQIELARRPRRAMTAAAKAHNISRATANRWAALCRQHGYLPSGREPS